MMSDESEYIRPTPVPTGLPQGFYSIEEYSGSKCIIPKCKGSDIRVKFVEVDANDRFHQLTALRTNQRSQPAIATIGYSYCNNPRCIRHVKLGTRKFDDSESLVKILKANHWKRQRKQKFNKEKRKNDRRRRS